MRLSEGPGLLYPLLGTGLLQALIYVCVWMGVGWGTCGGQRVAVSSSAALHYFFYYYSL